MAIESFNQNTTMFGKNEPANGTSKSVNTNALEVCNIAAGTKIEGNFDAQSNIRLEGDIIGDVRCTGRIVLSKGASIKGNVICHTMICEGKVIGDVKAQTSIHLHGTAELQGNIEYQTLQIDQGALFNGRAVCLKTVPKAVAQD